jgi:probable F420-dependent oxidoreductase
MQNDVSRQWAFLAPIVPGAVLSAQVQGVEALGMAGIFVPEIYSSPFMGLGYCAALTDRVQLASGISNAFASSPFEIAMTAIDLDRISDGRVVLGLGTSVKVWTEGFYGLPYGKPVAHMREVIDVVRLVVAKSHTGELDRFEGDHVNHDWSTFMGAFAPPLRTEIPIWLAANQTALTRLAGELCEGFIDHPIHGTKWMLSRGREALDEGLRAAGRDRSDIHWNSWLWVAINDDRAEALDDARATVAFYAGIAQYEPMFASMGFGAEAQACSAALAAGDLAASAGSISDEMAETFVILGSVDDCRKRIAEVWDLADSFCLVPPIGGLPPEKIAAYAGAIAETFYS